jgi:hypothetical protein
MLCNRNEVNGQYGGGRIGKHKHRLEQNNSNKKKQGNQYNTNVLLANTEQVTNSCSSTLIARQNELMNWLASWSKNSPIT